MDKRRFWILGWGAGLSLAALLAWRSRHAPFIYDDIDQIVMNARLHPPLAIWEAALSELRRNRVLQNLSFALDWRVSAGATWSFHLTGYLLHALNATLLLKLLRRWLPGRPWPAFVAFLLFLVHPLQVQGVAYAMGRVSLLQCFFYLAAMDLFSRRRHAAALFTVFLGLFAKEACALIPLVLFGWDRLAVASEDRVRVRPALWVLFGLVGALVVPITFLLRDPVSVYSGTVGFSIYPVWEYFRAQGVFMAWYACNLVAPFGLSIIHEMPDLGGWTSLAALSGFALAGGSLLLALRLYRQGERVGAFFIFFFWVSALPTQGPLQMINPLAEYRLYQPNIAAFVLMGLALERLSRVMRACVGGVALVYVACASWVEYGAWANDVELIQRSLAHYPSSYRLHSSLGGSLEARGDMQGAEREYQIAAMQALSDRHLKTLRPIALLAQLYLRTGRFRQALELLQDPRMVTFVGHPMPVPYYVMSMRAAVGLGDRALFERLKTAAVMAYPHAADPPNAWIPVWPRD